MFDYINIIHKLDERFELCVFRKVSGTEVKSQTFAIIQN